MCIESLLKNLTLNRSLATQLLVLQRVQLVLILILSVAIVMVVIAAILKDFATHFLLLLLYL